MIKVEKNKFSRMSQGDVYREITYIEQITENEGIMEVTKIIFPYVVVLTQDCDLEQDFKYRDNPDARNQDKYLLSVLVAPLYNADHVFQGEHLSLLGIEMEVINRRKTPGDYLVKNERPRYHYLDFPDSVPIVPSVIDFKHYFCVNVEYLKSIREEKYVCTISELFRENVSQRFANYLSRIGLPDAVHD